MCEPLDMILSITVPIKDEDEISYANHIISLPPNKSKTSNFHFSLADFKAIKT